MEEINVRSSNLKTVSYNEKKAILEIQFHKGMIYQYLDVPKEIVEGLLNASSKGRYHHKFIVGRFIYKRIR